MIRSLTNAEQTELDELNRAVMVAIETRTKWLDRKMVEASSVQVGDDLYDLDNGNRMGTVTKLYRYWRDRDQGIWDISYSPEYEYRIGPNILDNTSRLGRATSIAFGSLEDAQWRRSGRGRISGWGRQE